MVFNSVFDSLSEVKEVLNSGRIDEKSVIVNINKKTVTVCLNNQEEYFENFKSDSYYMSPGGEHEKQVLFYGEFNNIEKFTTELLTIYLGSNVSINYRGDKSSTNFILNK